VIQYRPYLNIERLRYVNNDGSIYYTTTIWWCEESALNYNTYMRAHAYVT